jgi:hypothetical protein
MLKSVVKQWEKNKHKIRERFLVSDIPNSYVDLVKFLFRNVLTAVEEGTHYDTEGITVVDDGDSQGTLIFIIPMDTYQPTISEYMMTYVFYGSCSGCDALESILCDDGDREQQISDLTSLCLNLVQNTRYLDYKMNTEDAISE